MSTTGTKRPTTTGQRKLSEVARHLVLPSGIVSTGWPSVRQRCRSLGVRFDRWQDGAGRCILAKRADGLYASGIGGVVVSIPRQVGKTYLLGGIIFALCLLHPGITVLWTSHQLRTTNETFRAMQGMARRPKVRPNVLAIRRGAGDLGIEFLNGSRVLFGAREMGFGLGFAKVSLIVFDEAQRLTERGLDDMLPTMNQAPNPLFILIGTPPRPTDAGEVFSRRRTEALSGEADDMLYIEMSADPDTPRDRIDWEQVAKANASYPLRTPAASVMRLWKNLGADSFWREGYGIWDVATQEDVPIPPQAWESCLDRQSERPTDIAFGFSVLPDLSAAIIAVAGRRPDGRTHVEIVDVLRGAGGLVARLVELCKSWHPSAVALNNAGAARAYLPALAEAGLVTDPNADQWKLTPLSAGDYAGACMGLAGDVIEGQLRHIGDDVLTGAVAAARKRPLSQGWAFVDRTGVLEAVTLARHGFATFAAQPAPPTPFAFFGN